jgi:hypothetical protein
MIAQVERGKENKPLAIDPDFDLSRRLKNFFQEIPVVNLQQRRCLGRLDSFGFSGLGQDIQNFPLDIFPSRFELPID